MKRFLLSVGAVIAAALTLAACGAAASTSSSGTGLTKGGTSTVDTMQFQGFGSVLVNAAGQPLYASDQETNGMVKCNGACNSFWMPLTITTGSPSETSANGALGVVTRPDGTKQVTFDGKLLYTFSLDKAGKLNGDGVADAFGSQKFTWHVVRVNASGGAASGQSGGVVHGY